MKTELSLRLISAALLALATQAAHADFPWAGTDVAASMGQFTINVAEQYRSQLGGLLDNNGNITSPKLFDPATVINRSNPLIDGSAADVNYFPAAPSGFEVPGTREVHTQIQSFNMVDDPSNTQFQIRAGAAADPGTPASYGEVESLSHSGNSALDFAAKSFFDVFVNIDFGGLTFYNKDALVIQNNDLQGFPPTVVYIHENPTAVPIYLKEGPNFSSTDALFGYLTLAGHGVMPIQTNPFTGEIDIELEMKDLTSALDTALAGAVPAQIQSSVPEIEEWAMMLFGLPMIAWTVRRKR